jgi:hypothetical protein
MSTVKDLENRFLPIFRKMAAEIAVEYPKVHSNVWSYPIGAMTDYHGHGLGVECAVASNTGDPADQSQVEFVALMINLKHLNTGPKIDTVLVSWGSGIVEAQLSPESVEITEDNLAEIEKHLPEMFGVLKSAVRRGHPPMD